MDKIELLKRFTNPEQRRDMPDIDIDFPVIPDTFDGFVPGEIADLNKGITITAHGAPSDHVRVELKDGEFHVQEDGSVIITREVYEQLVQDGHIKDDSVVSMSISGVVAKELNKAMESKLDRMMMVDEFEPQFMNREARRKEARSNRKKGNVRNPRR